MFSYNTHITYITYIAYSLFPPPKKTNYPTQP